jgi:hypothetical protein
LIPPAVAPRDMGDGDTLLNAVVGALVTVVLSFTGFSPLLGGGVAGYLQRGDRSEGARVGALSGAIATVPFVFILAVVVSVFGLFVAGGGPAEAGLGLVLGVVVFVFALAWNIALGAIGGYLGVYVLAEFEDGRADATR